MRRDSSRAYGKPNNYTLMRSIDGREERSSGLGIRCGACPAKY
jgi:hypothetical protein